MNTDLLSAPMVMAIRIASTPTVLGAASKGRNKTVGISFADTTTRQLGVADFVDNDLFSNTEVRCFTVFVARGCFILNYFKDSSHTAGRERSPCYDRNNFWDDG